MRRVTAWGLALALIVALAACSFVRWPLSAAKVGDSLNAAFGASPRLHWSAPKAASFSFLPWPSVRILDARLDDAYGVDLLSAPSARLNLSLIDLLRADGVAILLVEQNVPLTLTVATRVYVMEKGEVRHEAPAAELSRDHAAIRRYLGV